MNIDEVLDRALERERLQKIEDLAERLGIARATIYRAKQGKGQLRYPNIVNLAELANLPTPIVEAAWHAQHDHHQPSRSQWQKIAKNAFFMGLAGVIFAGSIFAEYAYKSTVYKVVE
jgi:transcriptional regulator with XRE-family HTH domain